MSESQDETQDILILGAGRQGRNALDLCRMLGVSVKGFLDDTRQTGDEVDGVPVLGGFALAHDTLHAGTPCFVAVGHGPARAKARSGLGERVADSLVHPHARLAPSATLGAGSFLSAGVYARSGAQIGEGALFEARSDIGVDVQVGAFVGTGPGVALTGGVQVGAYSYLGANAVVTNEAKVGARVTVGAGAVVLEDVPDGVFVAGIPAKIRERRGAQFPPPAV